MAARPNVLFLFPDQLRWDWIGCHGSVPVRTPHIDALAARGVRFTQCRSNSPLCGPARACLAMGLRYGRTGVWGNGEDVPRDAITCFRLLREAGYHTMTCGKNDLHKGTGDFDVSGWTARLGDYGFSAAIDQRGKMNAGAAAGWDEPSDYYTQWLEQRGLRRMHHEDYVRRREEARHYASTWPSPLPRESYSDDVTGAAALKLLDAAPTGKPWMLWVNFPGPHDPFDPPAALRRRYDDVHFPMPVKPEATIVNPRGQTVALDHQQLRRNYAACIEGIDEWVGRIVRTVERRGELANTVIVFSSDHGEMLGDHGRFQKSVPWEGSVRVPLIAAGPGVVRGVVSDALVELVDLSATLLELAGLQAPRDWDSRSLRPVLEGATSAHRDVQCVMLRRWRMACDGQWKLVEHRDGEPALYDRLTDRDELRNVAVANPSVVAWLGGWLRETFGDVWPGV